MMLVFLSYLTSVSIIRDYAYLSNIISIRDTGVSSRAKVVDVKSTIHYGNVRYTTYKYTIITNQETKTITLNHNYQLSKTINIINKVPSDAIEGTKTMSSWDLYQLNYQNGSALQELFSLLLLCSCWFFGMVKLFTYNWWI